jgi:hypothetical protein
MGGTRGDAWGILGGYRRETGRIRWGEAFAKQHLSVGLEEAVGNLQGVDQAETMPRKPGM